MCGDHAPSFFFLANPAIQSHNIQPEGFLAKMRGPVRYGCPNLVWQKMQQSMSFFYLLSSYELLGYFPWFVVSKSLRIEVFHSIISVMFSNGQLI